MFSSAVLGVTLALFVVCQGAPTEEPRVPCDREDPYCKGTSFPEKVYVNNRIISCNVVPNPKKHCCLPQAEHLVCYDIKVDGSNLNFGSTNSIDRTDFHGLCKAMLKKEDESIGKVSAIYQKDGGGGLRYKDNEFDVVTAEGTTHIKHLACSLKSSDGNKYI